MVHLFLALTVLISAAVPALCLEKVRVATSSPSVGSFPYFLASKKGFYRSEGLDAEIIFVRANIALTALVSSEVDFIVSRPELRDWNAFRGKKIAVSSPGTTTEQEVKAGLKLAGLKAGEVSLLAFGGQETRLAALEARAVDATVLDSVRTAFMTRRGFRSLANLGEMTKMPFMGVGVSHEKIRNKPDLIRRMVRGTARAVRYIKENPFEAQKAMDELLAIRDAELTRSIYGLVVGLYNDRVLPDALLQAAIDEEREQLKIQRAPSISEVVDWSFLQEVQEKR